MRKEFLLTESNYYDQYLNTAIFFDPYRIYFNNSEESLALDFHYKIQRDLSAKPSSKKGHIFFLIYGKESVFEKYFNDDQQAFSITEEGINRVLGIRATHLEGHYLEILEALNN